MCNKIIALDRDGAEEIVGRIERGGVFGTVSGSEACSPAFPGDIVPVIVNRPTIERDVCRLSVENLIWGFEAEWKSGVVFNTRIESALSGKGMWIDAIRDGRCVVPTFGFFETHASEKARDRRTGRIARQRYLFTTSGDGHLTYLAAIKKGGRFSIVTTEANDYVSPMHSRMPIVLRERELDVWLGSSFASLADRGDVPLHAKAMLDPYGGESGEGDAQLSLF